MILRIDIGYKGFRGILSTSRGTIYYDSYSQQDQKNYLCYYRSDYTGNGDPIMACETLTADKTEIDWEGLSAIPDNGEELSIFRLAMACTGEYASYHGGTVPLALSAIVTTVNRVNMVYMRDLSVKLELIDDNDELIFLNANSDPYNNNNGGAMLNQNAQTVNSIIGSPNYDIGHVVSTGGGGIANYAAVCTVDKARGVTGLNTPVGDPFDIDYVAHEIGHQLGGNHTFNGNTGGCAGNGIPFTAFEPGSGSTIMAYAGICGSQNVASNSSDYFHVGSLIEILNNLNNAGGICAQVIPTENSNPVSNPSSGNWILPSGTPFMLDGTGSDDDPKNLTYCWEQFDLGPAGDPDSPSGEAPLFRSFAPNNKTWRTFPDFQKLLSGAFIVGEYLPDYNRDLRFQLTVRDNHPVSGGVAWSDIEFEARTGNSDFTVNFPQEGAEWRAGDQSNIAWSVGGTDQAPFNCSNVDIFLVYNDGNSFYTIAEDVPNNGSTFETVPGINCDDCRIMVKGSEHIFFNISPGPFSIDAPMSVELNSMQSSICLGEGPAVFEYTFSENFDFSGDIEMSLEGLPDDFNVLISPDDFNSLPQTVSVEIETLFPVAEGTNPFQLSAETSKGPQVIDGAVSVINSGASELQLNTPVNGAESVQTGALFSWQPILGADNYDWELALSATFGVNVISSASDLLGTEHVYNGSLQEDNIYYWRVIADNGCSEGLPSSTYVFRASQEVAATPPIRANTNSFLVQQGEEKTITGSNLLVTDAVSSSDEILYTITNEPSHGSLMMNGNILQAGASFSQLDVNSGKLSYDHNGIPLDSDKFGFHVVNVEGGWLPDEWFDIDVNVFSGIEENLGNKRLNVYPNPSSDYLYARFETITGAGNWMLCNIVGQKLAQGLLQKGDSALEIDLKSIPRGVYVLSLKSDTVNDSRKVVVK